MNLVVDASVAAKWYLEEQDADRARALLESDAFLVAPELVLTEVANVVWKKRGLGQITEGQVEEIVWHLPGVFLALVSARDLIGRAIQIALTLKHSVYDCMYLAALERWDAPLITADRKLLERLSGTEWAARVHDLRIYSP